MNQNENSFKQPCGLRWSLFAIFCAALVLHNHIPMVASTYSPHDAGLFFRATNYLLDSSWLGPYDNLTLAKGPMLSLLGALSHILGFAYKPLEFFIYLVVSLFIAIFLFSRTRSAWLTIVLFFALAFNPVFWSLYGMCFMRESLYIPTSLAVFMAFLWGFWEAGSLKKQMILGAGAGVAFAAFWLTREEGVWLYPALVALFCLAVITPKTTERWSVFLRKRLKRLGIVLVCSATSASVLIAIVASINYYHYGKFITCEFRSPEFKHAYSALTRIRSEADARYVPVSNRALEKAFAVSPAAAELASAFGTVEEITAENGQPEKRYKVVRNIGASMFMWSFRGAAQHAGHFTDAVSSANYFQKVGDEINAACEDGRLDCRDNRESFAPPFPWQYSHDFIKAFVLSFWKIVSLDYGDRLKPLLSRDKLGHLADWDNILGKVAPSEELANEPVANLLYGYITAKGSQPTIIMRIPDLENKKFQLALEKSPRVDRSLKQSGQTDFTARNFTIITDCLEENCMLEASIDQNVIGSISMAQILKNLGKVAFSDDFKMVILSHKIVSKPNNSLLRRPMFEKTSYNIMNVYGPVSKILFPVLFLLATIGILCSMVWLRAKPHCVLLTGLATVCLIAVGTRAGLVAYLDTCSWSPAVTVNYLMPAYGFGIFYAIVGTYLLFLTIKHLRARKFGQQKNLVDVP